MVPLSTRVEVIHLLEYMYGCFFVKCMHREVYTHTCFFFKNIDVYIYIYIYICLTRLFPGAVNLVQPSIQIRGCVTPGHALAL